MTWRENRSFVPDPTFASHPDTWPNGAGSPDDAAPSFGVWANTGEERIVDPATGGAKGRKLARHELLPPEALTAIAERFGMGAAKYGDAFLPVTQDEAVQQLVGSCSCQRLSVDTMNAPATQRGGAVLVTKSISRIPTPNTPKGNAKTAGAGGNATSRGRQHTTRTTGHLRSEKTSSLFGIGATLSVSMDSQSLTNGPLQGVIAAAEISSVGHGTLTTIMQLACSEDFSAGNATRGSDFLATISKESKEHSPTCNVRKTMAWRNAPGGGILQRDSRNWEKGYDWSLSYGALQRHLLAFWGGEDVDAEFGDSHLAAAGFHIFVLLSFIQNHPGGDDRPTTKETS